MVKGIDAGKRREKSGCEDILEDGLGFDQAAGFGDGGEEEVGEREEKKVRGLGENVPFAPL